MPILGHKKREPFKVLFVVVLERFNFLMIASKKRWLSSEPFNL